MTTADDEARDELERLVALVYEAIDAAPDDVVDKAGEYARWRADGDIAFIVSDDVEALVAVRGPADVAAGMQFRTGGLRIDVSELDGRLVGTIAPWAGGTAVLESGQLVTDVVVDDDGWFDVVAPGRGSVRLRFTAADGVATRTDWFLVSPHRGS